jgi:hypothetical protein
MRIKTQKLKKSPSLRKKSLIGVSSAADPELLKKASATKPNN